MTNLDRLILWLKTCPVDYLYHNTEETRENLNQVVVTFDVLEEHQ